jgi:uncharacterized membrane protein
MARLKLRDKWHRAAIPAIIYTFIIMIPAFVASVLSIDELRLLPSKTAALIQNIISVYQILVIGVMSIGMSSLSLKIIRDLDFKTDTIFTGFKKYGRSFCSGFFVNLLRTLWICLFTLPGIILLLFGSGMVYIDIPSGYAFIFLGAVLSFVGIVAASIFTTRYSMTYLLVSDNRNLSASKALNLSVTIMRGNQMSLFSLLLSFIGWIILALIPLYISVYLVMMTNTHQVMWIPAIILALISFIGYAYVLLYIDVSKAIFYSGLSGNFRINIDALHGSKYGPATSDINEYEGED